MRDLWIEVLGDWGIEEFRDSGIEEIEELGNWGIEGLKD